jgi:hypothetical protein
MEAAGAGLRHGVQPNYAVFRGQIRGVTGGIPRLRAVIRGVKQEVPRLRAREFIRFWLAGETKKRRTKTVRRFTV